jgi:hypothetical protein
MPQAAPAPQPAPETQSEGGASKVFADIGSNMMKGIDLLQSKFPEEAQKLSSIFAQYQEVVDSLGQSPDSQPKEPVGPGTTTPEAGAAKVQQAL